MYKPQEDLQQFEYIDLIIETLKKLKKERDKRIQVEKEIKQLEIALDKSPDWFTIERWARERRINWRYIGDPSGLGLGCNKLNALSEVLGYEVKKSFHPHYSEVNSYHRHVFEHLEDEQHTSNKQERICEQ